MTDVTINQKELQARIPVTWKNGENRATDNRLRKVCADFESIFVHYMLRSARKALPEDNLFGNTNESKIYKSMMDERMARAVSRGKGLGLGALLYNELSKHNTNAADNVSEYA
jgi:flagellar protein FlgJ